MSTDFYKNILEEYKYKNKPLEETIDALLKHMLVLETNRFARDSLVETLCDYNWGRKSLEEVIKSLEGVKVKYPRKINWDQAFSSAISQNSKDSKDSKD